MSEENRSNQEIHQEGIDHIKSNLDGGNNSSSSGAESRDSGGIAKDAGGVSSSAYVDSPVPAEQKSVVQSTVDTVKGYLGALSLGGGSKEGEGESKDSPSTSTEARNAGDSTTSDSNTAATGGVVASATAAASAATAAVVGSKEEKPQEEKKDFTTITTDQSSANPLSTSSAPAARKDETMTDAPSQKDPRDADVPGDKNAVSDEPGENASHAKKDNWPKENKSAIPTAGGERLGEKHWGESQMVPDVPRSQSEQAVSSEEGQPDNQTRDNTAQNTGGAAPPSSSSAANRSEGDAEGKQKFTDKIKEKLNIGKKE